MARLAALTRRLWDVLRRESITRFEGGAEAVHRTDVLLAAFYVFLLVLALDAMWRYQELQAMSPVLLRWPLAWARGLPWREVVIGVTAGFGAAAFAALGWRHHRWARALAFVGLLLFAGVTISFGRINHDNHHVLLPALLFALAPSWRRDPSPGPQAPMFRAVFAAQCLVMVTYSLSGFWKLRAGVEAWVAGRPGLFSGNSLPRIVADRAVQTAETPPLVDLAIAFPRISSLLYLVTVFIELTALATVLVPRLAAAWALALAAFHVMVLWSMHIHFPHSVVVLLVLFWFSPFLGVGRDRAVVAGDPVGPSPLHDAAPRR